MKYLSLSMRCLLVFICYGIGLSQGNAQEDDSLSVLDQYEKILLDGKVAYLHTGTAEIITTAEFDSILAGNKPPAIGQTKLMVEESYWDTTKVNPYKGIKLKPPFGITFDESHFHPPVDHKMVVTSRYGRRRRGPHRGIDIDLVTGDYVRSILPGKVRYVGYSRGHGKTVVVRHAHDVETVYAHLSEYNVKINEEVNAGSIIGQGGNTGRSRGSHLHLEIRYKGVCIHPEYVLDFAGDHKIRSNELWITKGMINPRNHTSYRKSDIHTYHTYEIAAEAQKREKKIYVVRKGDTLWGIARKNGMYIKEILTLNKISSKSVLRIGQHLVLSD